MLDEEEIEKIEAATLKLTPSEIVEALDKYVVGRNEAKKAIAIALRNRYRRRLVKDELKNEISPKNILMIGSTGVGKTELSRRIAKITQVPFLKVEATKFTEVGYVGRDVESIIRDLIEIAISEEKKIMLAAVENEAKQRAEEKILDILLPIEPAEEVSENSGMPPFGQMPTMSQMSEMSGADKRPLSEKEKNVREMFRKKLQSGELEERQIEIEISIKSSMPFNPIEIGFAPMNESQMDKLGGLFKNIMQSVSPKNKRKVKIKVARKILSNEIAESMIDLEKIITTAIYKAENMGIVFIDEIDKIVSKGSNQGIDVSREGVQRDILPLVEGSSVNTKYGVVKTDHILFIAAGAFHISSPADIIPELQGRFPIRVELEPLNVEDLKLILTEPKNALMKQYHALLKTEGVELVLKKDAQAEIAQIAHHVNSTTDNIGARRLSTIMEKLLEDILFESTSSKTEKKIVIDKTFVKDKLENIVKDKDLSRFIL